MSPSGRWRVRPVANPSPLLLTNGPIKGPSYDPPIRAEHSAGPSRQQRALLARRTARRTLSRCGGVRASGPLATDGCKTYKNPSRHSLRRTSRCVGVQRPWAGRRPASASGKEAPRGCLRDNTSIPRSAEVVNARAIQGGCVSDLGRPCQSATTERRALVSAPREPGRSGAIDRTVQERVLASPGRLCGR